MRRTGSLESWYKMDATNKELPQLVTLDDELVEFVNYFDSRSTTFCGIVSHFRGIYEINLP